MYPAYSNAECHKKFLPIQGLDIALCYNFNHNILLSNWFIEMNVSMQFEVGGEVFQATAFPKVLNDFLDVEILDFRDEPNKLVSMLLKQQKVDYTLSSNKKIIVSIKNHVDIIEDRKKSVTIKDTDGREEQDTKDHEEQVTDYSKYIC